MRMHISSFDDLMIAPTVMASTPSQILYALGCGGDGKGEPAENGFVRITS